MRSTANILATCTALAIAARAPAQAIDWQLTELRTRSGAAVDGAQRGQLRVPQMHGASDGPQLQLALLRLPSTSASPGAPIVYLADDASDSAIAQASGPRFALLDALRAHGDVIALDHRGAGESEPHLQAAPADAMPLDRAPDREAMLDHYRAWLARAIDTMPGDVDLAQFHADAAADDLQQLRRALGVERLRLLGMGYGAHVGLAMLRRHPDAIERIVLAGPRGPDQLIGLPSTLEAGLDHAARLLAADPATARLLPDLRQDVARLRDRLAQTPATARAVDPRSGDAVSIRIGAFDLQMVVAMLVGRRDALPHLPALLLPMRDGDFDGIAPLVLRLRRHTPALLQLVVTAAAHASPARLQQLAAQRPEALLGGVHAFPHPDLNASIGVPALPAASRAAPRSPVPTLFISGTLDLRAPPAAVEQLMRGFPRSEHVIVEGAGHDNALLVGDPAIANAIDAFLRGQPPARRRIVLPPLEFVLPPPSAMPAQQLLIEHARVLEPSGGHWREDHTVVMRGERIVCIAPSGTVAESAEGRRIDAAGNYVIPGLIDLHVHLSKLRRPALPLFVYHGVTGVRDLGGELDEVRRWQRAIAAGSLTGPRIWTVGAYLEHPANIERMLREDVVEPVERARIGVRDPGHAAEVVAGLAARGVDGIKVRTFADKATYFAIAEAAAGHGLPLYGHAQQLSAEDVLRAGQRSIEHGFLPPLAARSAADRAALARALADAGVALVPTLAAWEHSILVPRDTVDAIVAGTAPGRHGLRPLVAAFTIADWREQAAERTDGAMRVYRSMLPHYMQDVRLLLAAGVAVLPGSDCGVLLMQPGASLHDELALFVRDLGMSPGTALRAATADAAAFLGAGHRGGRLLPGGRADLVVLGADPLADIAALADIEAVVVGGRWLGPDERAALLEEVRAMPELTENDWHKPARDAAKGRRP